MACPPCLDALPGPSAEEHLPRDHHGQARAVGQFDHRRLGARDRVRRYLVDRRPERLEQATQGHVLAERDAAHLVVAAGHFAVGGDDDLGVGDPTGLAGHVLGDPDRERDAEPRRLGGDELELLAGREVDGVDHVLRPQHEVERLVGFDRAGRLEVAVGDDARRHVDRPRALFATALHRGDVEELAGAAARGGDERQRQHDDRGEHGADGQRLSPTLAARRRRRSARRPRSRPGTRPT